MTSTFVNSRSFSVFHRFRPPATKVIKTHSRRDSNPWAGARRLRGYQLDHRGDRLLRYNNNDNITWLLSANIVAWCSAVDEARMHTAEQQQQQQQQQQQRFFFSRSDSIHTTHHRGCRLVVLVRMCLCSLHNKYNQSYMYTKLKYTKLNVLISCEMF